MRLASLGGAMSPEGYLLAHYRVARWVDAPRRPRD
jgi:hypothetical protein